MADTADVVSIDPRTGTPAETVAAKTTAEQVDALCRAAAQAAPLLAATPRLERARILRAVAAALEAERAAIVALADRETALGETRLNGELTRTCYQFEQFAVMLEDGSYLEAVIDHAGDTPMGPRPDLRRMLVPLGPVAVFGSSNFPLAFSVPGGDTAAALAAGCPVVVKAHSSHPATSKACHDAMTGALSAAGAPEGTLGIVYGQKAGAELVRHPAIQAVGFTGSLGGGRALFDIASSRPDPIPFYGELGSVNPLVVTPGAADARAEEIANGIVGSFTMGAGQFCTKPGLVFLPEGGAGRRLGDAIAAAVAERGPAVLLNANIQRDYQDRWARAAEDPSVERRAEGAAADEQGWGVPVRLLATSAAEFTAETAEECFGPIAVLVTYRDSDEVAQALAKVPNSLAATLIAEDDEKFADEVAPVLRGLAGRLVYNGYPTGVAVAWGMTHGGAWPSTTNALHTSVGMTSARRFLRPLTWQDTPQRLLPDELRDTPGTPLPRRVDGRLETAAG
ncbi:aldehyde dehydrogenase (NADP(+)) [Actinorugispora endophytica]|uniref:NADP-dependent aldehyde dehydrogenase n=1 Tax=Actinorugispora endophytica TaxID=1605990 RepID=A0A4R6UQG9_9ACTN|nr:aldehyde dehydrogenase (NADP(+)) [Actinorugispora endophytica]TDQ45504.1 NADP-dependent aldehyde dehydrogenase [Actinorugispora endophytica]